MGNRSRIFVTDQTAVGQAETIQIVWTAPFNAEILQVTGRFGQAVPPAIAGEFYVQREPNAGAAFFCAFVRFDPSVDGNLELVCSGHGWQMKMGDILRVIYPNPDDLTCGVEIILTEGQ